VWQQLKKLLPALKNQEEKLTKKILEIGY